MFSETVLAGVQLLRETQSFWIDAPTEGRFRFLSANVLSPSPSPVLTLTAMPTPSWMSTPGKLALQLPDRSAVVSACPSGGFGGWLIDTCRPAPGGAMPPTVSAP